MKDIQTFNYRKSTQAINYFVRQFQDLSLNKMKSLKLLWAADRYHLRKYGRPVVDGDTYMAMYYGPVPSLTKDLIEGNSYLPIDIIDYSEQYLKLNGRGLVSLETVDDKVFSETDLESLSFSVHTFGNMDIWELCNFTHNYPEWKKHEKELTSEDIRVEPMEYEDFFKNPEIQNDPFKLDSDVLETSKEIYEESIKINQMFK